MPGSRPDGDGRARACGCGYFRISVALNVTVIVCVAKNLSLLVSSGCISDSIVFFRLDWYAVLGYRTVRVYF
jgi:hypothetical protein